MSAAAGTAVIEAADPSSALCSTQCQRACEPGGRCACRCGGAFHGLLAAAEGPDDDAAGRRDPGDDLSG